MFDSEFESPNPMTSTITAEERAKAALHEIIASNNDGIKGDRSPTGWETRYQSWEDLIAAAIRDAEQAAYERGKAAGEILLVPPHPDCFKSPSPPKDTVAEFIASQKPLDADIARIIEANAAELYETDAPSPPKDQGHE